MCDMCVVTSCVVTEDTLLSPSGSGFHLLFLCNQEPGFTTVVLSQHFLKGPTRVEVC